MYPVKVSLILSANALTFIFLPEMNPLQSSSKTSFIANCQEMSRNFVVEEPQASTSTQEMAAVEDVPEQIKCPFCNIVVKSIVTGKE